MALAKWGDQSAEVAPRRPAGKAPGEPVEGVKRRRRSQEHRAPTLRTWGLVTRNQLASLLGQYPGTIIKWVGEGLPVEVHGGSGKPDKFRVADVWRWGLERERQRFAAESGQEGGPVSLALERARLARAQTQRAEFEMRRREGELLEAEDVGKVWSLIILSIRSKILALPRAMAVQVVQAVLGTTAEKAPAEVEGLLEAEMRNILRELNGWKLDTAGPAEEAS